MFRGLLGVEQMTFSCLSQKLPLMFHEVPGGHLNLRKLNQSLIEFES
jgi:hypothetical protein